MSENGPESSRYPLAEALDQEALDAEVRRLEEVSRKPVWLRIPLYLRLGGPGFLGAALTLGAGTLTASMLAGATFGYKTLWIYWVAIGSAVFMLAAMGRFTCLLGKGLIPIQKQRHGSVVAVVMTAMVAMAGVAIVFNFGQYALGTHLLESIGNLAGIPFPRSLNWILYMALTSWLVLSYGRGSKGTRFVESFMKAGLGLMFLCFAFSLAVVGIDWPAAWRGLLVPWLPRGVAGLDLFIATSAAAIGVMDWLMFHYAGLARGWGRRHEVLARFDIGMGLVFPFLAINFLVVCVFAGTLFGREDLPGTAAELAGALMPLLGESLAQIVFLVGFLAVPITTTVGMSLAGAIALHEAFGWKPDVRSLRWKACVLLPQIGFLAAWYPSPLLLIILIAAFLSLSNNIVGWSLYLLFNDPAVLGLERNRSRIWNIGILAQITLLNCVAIAYLFNRLGWWGQ